MRSPAIPIWELILYCTICVGAVVTGTFRAPICTEIVPQTAIQLSASHL